MRKQNLVFMSYEIHPVTAGGCGVFLWHTINELLATTDYKITLVLDIPKCECEDFINNYVINIENKNNLEVICLSDRIPTDTLPLEAFDNIFMYKSYIFYRVLEGLEKNRCIDYVEFFDYVGIGYFAVNAKKYENKFRNTILSIRAHCTVDLMDLEQRQIDFSKEKIEMYQMEKIALQNADTVIVQTQAWRSLYSKRYKIDFDKIVVAEPPMNANDFPKYSPVKNKNVLFYGRVFQLKGIDEYIDSAILYLKEKTDNIETKFYIVGYDGKTVDGKSYSEYLKKRIPKELLSRFIFTGKLNRKEFANVLNNISLAIFPNYIESFCYSIHEIYEAGVPIICRSIPAFSDYFINNINCITYTGGAKQLADKLNLLLDSDELRNKLRCPFKVLKRIPQKEVYSQLLNKNMPSVVMFDIEVDEKISIIYINNCDSEIDFNINSNFIDIDKSFIIYSNPEYKSNSKLKEVIFLGNKVYIKPLGQNKNYDLNRFVAIFNLEDEVNINFIERTRNILANSDANYVISAYKNFDKRNIYPKYSLYKEHSYFIYNKFENMIIDNKKLLNLNDLFDSRSGMYGQIDYLGVEGYIIPETLIKKNSKSSNIISNNKEQLIFAINNNNRNVEWNPFEMNSFIDKSSYNHEVNNKFTKNIYHRFKDKLYKSDKRIMKILLKLLEFIKNLYVNSLKLFRRV